jgi:hypothetical protein
MMTLYNGNKHRIYGLKTPYSSPFPVFPGVHYARRHGGEKTVENAKKTQFSWRKRERTVQNLFVLFLTGREGKTASFDAVPSLRSHQVSHRQKKVRDMIAD